MSATLRNSFFVGDVGKTLMLLLLLLLLLDGSPAPLSLSVWRRRSFVDDMMKDLAVDNARWGRLKRRNRSRGSQEPGALLGEIGSGGLPVAGSPVSSLESTFDGVKHVWTRRTTHFQRYL